MLNLNKFRLIKLIQKMNKIGLDLWEIIYFKIFDGCIYKIFVYLN